MENLEKQFNAALLQLYQRAKTEANYPATVFFEMLQSRGGIATVKYLINSPKPSDGYTALYLKGRLDLTVEAFLFSNKKWHPLFSDEDVESARKRLIQYNYIGSGELNLSEDREASSQILKIKDVLKPGARIWAHPVWGPMDGHNRVRAFGKEATARRLEKEGSADLDMILSIGVSAVQRHLPKELTGRILDISTFIPKVMRTEDIIGVEQYRIWMQGIENDRARWPWGLPVSRAWKVMESPAADDVLPGLRKERFAYHHHEHMTTLLSSEEVERVKELKLNPIIFSVPLVDSSGIAAHTKSTDLARRCAARLARIVAARCKGTRNGYIVLRPGFETNESDLPLLIGKLLDQQQERCALCNGPLDLSDSPNWLAQASVDRLNGAIKVYDESNLQITHLCCNLGKNRSQNEEAIEFFRSWCGDGLPL